MEASNLSTLSTCINILLL